MSQIRSASDLQQEMIGEFAWRKKELHSIKTMVASYEGTEQDMRIRAAIALLYAHWEGFIKKTGGLYLEFVSRQQLSHDQLSPSFLALAATRVSDAASSHGKVRQFLEIARFFKTGFRSRSNLPWRTTIKTKSNLNSEVFREIIDMLGLDYSRFATKAKLIDERLVRNRNEIAHGQYLLVQSAQYLDLHDAVLAMMTDFYNQIDNSVTMGAYRAPV